MDYGVKYSCKFCDYKATQKENLQQHMKSIPDRVNHSCEFCEYKATTKSHLQQHVKSFHDEFNIVVSSVTIRQL